MCHFFPGLIPESPVGFVGVVDPDTIEDKTYRPKASNDLQWFKVSYLISQNIPFILGGGGGEWG